MGQRFFLLLFLSAAALVPFLRGEEIFYLDSGMTFPLFRTPSGEWSNADSRVTLIQQEDALVLKALCRKPAGSSFSGKECAPDAPGVFAGDLFEFLVSPRAGVYYHLALSPAGGFYTAKGRDTRWGENEGVTAACRVRGDEWEITFLLPYAAMEERKPEAGKVWKICIGQILPAEYEWHEASSLTGAKDYHNISEYASCVFGEKRAGDPVQLTRVVPELSGCRFIFSVPETWQGEIRGQWGKQNGIVPETIKREGERLSFLLPYPEGNLPLKTVLPVQLTVGKNILSGKVRFADPAKWEMDRFYLMPGEREISLSHAISGRVMLHVTDENGRIVLKEHPIGCKAKITLPANAAPGAYRIFLRGDFGTVCREVVLLPGAVSLFPGDLSVFQGKLCREGKPLFLVGISRTGKTFLPGPAFSLDLGKQGAKENAVPLLMLSSVPYLRAERAMDYPALPEHLERVMKQIQKEDPEGRAMVRLAYEANQSLRENGRPVSPADFMKRFYEGLKARAGKRLITIQCDDRDQMAELSASCDVFECATYSGSYAPWMMERISEDMKEIKAKTAPGKPLLFFLGGMVPNKVCRQSEEIRCASALAMIHGIQGVIIHLGHGSLPPERKRLWSLLAHLDDEMQGIWSRIAEGEEVTSRYPLPAPLVHRAVKRGDKIILLIVNPTGMPMQTPHGFFAPYGIRVVEINFSGRVAKTGRRGIL